MPPSKKKDKGGSVVSAIVLDDTDAEAGMAPNPKTSKKRVGEDKKRNTLNARNNASSSANNIKSTRQGKGSSKGKRKQREESDDDEEPIRCRRS